MRAPWLCVPGQLWGVAHAPLGTPGDPCLQSASGERLRRVCSLCAEAAAAERGAVHRGSAGLSISSSEGQPWQLRTRSGGQMREIPWKGLRNPNQQQHP